MLIGKDARRPYALSGHQRPVEALHPRTGFRSGAGARRRRDLPLPIWEIQETELINALRLKVFWQEITAAQADAQIDHFAARRRCGLIVFPALVWSALTESLRQLCAETSRLGCRTLDSLPVACGPPLKADTFVTFDTRHAHSPNTTACASRRDAVGGYPECVVPGRRLKTGCRRRRVRPSRPVPRGAVRHRRRARPRPRPSARSSRR
jgi:hypothetical protein